MEDKLKDAVSQGLSLILGSEVSPEVVGRLLDAVSGLSQLGDSGPGRKDAQILLADELRQWIVGRITAWEGIVAQREVPAILPIDID